MTQAKRTLATLLGLAVVATGLGLYAYFGVMRPDEAEAERKEVDGQLFAVRQQGELAVDGGHPQATFVSITVKAHGETTTLARAEDGGWSLTTPVQAATDRFAVDALVNQLQTAKLKEKVEEAPDDAALAKYGLRPPQFSVHAKALAPKGASGEREVKVEGGIENPFDGTVYVRKDGDPAVYAVEGAVRWSLEKTPYDLRDKEVFGFDETKVKKLTVTGGPQPFTLEQHAPKQWRLTQPLESPADAASVASLLGSLRSERASGFPTSAPAGPTRPAGTLAATMDSGDVVAWAFHRPTADAGTPKLFVHRQQGGQGVWAEVNETALSALNRDPTELRDRSILSFRQDTVAQAAFRLADGTELVVRKQLTDAGAPESWDVTAPKPGAAKKWKVSSLLWALSSLRWAAEGEKQPKNLARFGLDAAARQVVLSDANGTQLARLVLGKEVPRKPDTLYVMGDQGRVFEADATRLAEFPTDPSDLLEGATAGDAGAPQVQ